MIRRIFPLIMGAVLLVGFPATEAQAKDGKKLVLRVVVNLGSSFDSAIADSGIGRAFFVRGTICEDLAPLTSCVPIGTFLCWGWHTDPFDVDARPQVSVVSQQFNIFDRGKIQTQGAEAFGPDSERAVVGGTGDFRNVRGEVTGAVFTLPPPGPTAEFIATFKLIGAKGKGKKKKKK